MTPLLWLQYLFGRADAIQRVAASRAALWTGIALVLLTSVARNYDQTLIAEKPFLWFFGSLVFSFFSGSWIYCVVFEMFARPKHFGLEQPTNAFNARWRSFMALFWMTAPVAWLYAIPVERFLDTMTAARANLLLLAIVSLWRVLLMARVLQVTTRAPFLMTLCWVLFAAAVETLVIVFFGGAFAQAIVRGMGGMRNSPEEELVMNVMGGAFSSALIIAPVALVVSLAWRPNELLQPLPVPVAAKMSWTALLIAAAIWSALAVGPQRELANNVAVERLMSSGQSRAALDFMAARTPADFAPARPLPPKPFEREVFTQLPACFGVVQTNDPPWVRALLLTKLDAMMSHMGPRWGRRAADLSQTREEKIKTIKDGLSWHGPDGGGLKQLFDGLARFPEGQAWLATNHVFIEAVWEFTANPGRFRRRQEKSEPEQLSDWLTLSNQLAPRFLTNAPATK